MLFEKIIEFYYFFLTASPWLSIILIVAGFFTEGKKAWFCILAGLIFGFVGCGLAYPDQMDGWGWGMFYVFFIFIWCFSFGYIVSWALIALRSTPQKRTLGSLLVVALIGYILIAILHEGYAKKVEKNANVSVRSYISGSLSQTDLEATGFHQSKIFRNEVNLQLGYYPENFSEMQVRFLYKHGFNIYRCSACPRDLMDAALKFDSSEEASRALPMFSLSALASNPTINEQDFIRLASLRDEGIFQSLITNRVTDERRYQILRPILAETIENFPITDHNSEWQKNRLVDCLKYLDDTRKRRLDQQKETNVSEP
jgi:hypothetical protein